MRQLCSNEVHLSCGDGVAGLLFVYFRPFRVGVEMSQAGVKSLFLEVWFGFQGAISH